MSVPDVSIVCSVRNGLSHLEGFEAAVRAAWTDECELVVLDHGSDDGTTEALAAWRERFPEMVLLHSTSTAGVGVAKAEALQAASGTFVWIVDCDDRFPADAVRTLIAAARRDDADVVVGRARAVDADGNELQWIDAAAAPAVLQRQEALEQLLDGRIEGYTWTKLFRRALFDPARDSDGFAAPLTTTQSDFCRTSTALARADRVSLVPDTVYSYVRHGGSLLDRRSQPVDNLVTAQRHLVRIARALLPPGMARRRRIAHFTTWFVAASAVKIPVYVCGDEDTRRLGRDVARRAMRDVLLTDLLRMAPKAAAQAVLLRLSPRVYELAFRLRLRLRQG